MDPSAIPTSISPAPSLSDYGEEILRKAYLCPEDPNHAFALALLMPIRVHVPSNHNTGFRAAKRIQRDTPHPAESPVTTEGPCVLNKLAPEIRKKIFLDVLDSFFHQHPTLEEIEYVNRSFDLNSAKQLHFAGLQIDRLQSLELTLLCDSKLHREFITARAEMSTLVLSSVVRYNDDSLSEQYLFPTIQGMKLLVLGSVRVVKYNLWPRVNKDNNVKDDGVTTTTPDYEGRSKKLAQSFLELMSEGNPEPNLQTSLSTTENKTFLPQLQKLVIKCPRETDETFADFLKHRKNIWPGLKVMFDKSKITTFEVQHSHYLFLSGLGEFSKDLDAILGVEHAEVMEGAGLFWDREEPYFKYKSTWKTAGGKGKLVWNSEAEVRLGAEVKKGAKDVQQ